jgi:hypothetical protein
MKIWDAPASVVIFTPTSPPLGGGGFLDFLRRIINMDDVLTIAQIEAQFESEWVLVEDPQTNEAQEVQRGKVRWHSKDRDEVYRKAVELRPKRFAMLYTGEMPEDTAIVL